MREVTKEEFFKKMNPLDVHPRIVSDWNDEIGYVQEWRLQNLARTLVGKSQSGDAKGAGNGKRFWLVCEKNTEEDYDATNK